jgi:hypothetical protein
MDAPMIRHCVFIRFAPEITSGHKEDLFRQIAGLQSRVPGFLATHAGSNVSPETGMDKGYSDGFIVDFADAAARDAYLSDTEHQKIGAMLVEAAAGGADGVLVYDFELADPS